MAKRLTSIAADARARIYIEPTRPAGACWRLSPTAVPRFADTPGAALDRALEHLGNEPAVVIWSGRNG